MPSASLAAGGKDDGVIHRSISGWYDLGPRSEDHAGQQQGQETPSVADRSQVWFHATAPSLLQTAAGS